MKKQVKEDNELEFYWYVDTDMGKSSLWLSFEDIEKEFPVYCSSSIQPRFFTFIKDSTNQYNTKEISDRLIKFLSRFSRRKIDKDDYRNTIDELNHFETTFLLALTKNLQVSNFPIEIKLFFEYCNKKYGENINV